MPTTFEQAGKEKLKAVIDAAVDVIVTINHKGIIVSANRAIFNTFGYEVNEVIGKNISILMPTPFKAEHDGYLERYLSDGTKRIIGIGREVVGQKKDGTVFPIFANDPKLLLTTWQNIINLGVTEIYPGHGKKMSIQDVFPDFNYWREKFKILKK